MPGSTFAMWASAGPCPALRCDANSCTKANASSQVRTPLISPNGNYGILASRRGPLWLVLIETLFFLNGLGGRRGKEHDQRSSGGSLTAGGNEARGELGGVLSCGRERGDG